MYSKKQEGCLFVSSCRNFEPTDKDITIGIKNELINDALRTCYNNSVIKNKILSGSLVWDSLKIKFEWKFKECPRIDFGTQNELDEFQIMLIINNIYIRLTKENETNHSVARSFNLKLGCNVSLFNNCIEFEPANCSVESRDALDNILSESGIACDENINNSGDIPIEEVDFLDFVINHLVFRMVIDYIRPMIPSIDIRKLLPAQTIVYNMQLFVENNFLVIGAGFEILKEEPRSSGCVTQFPRDSNFFLYIDLYGMLQSVLDTGSEINGDDNGLRAVGNMDFKLKQINFESFTKINVNFEASSILTYYTLKYLYIGNSFVEDKNGSCECNINLKNPEEITVSISDIKINIFLLLSPVILLVIAFMFTFGAALFIEIISAIIAAVILRNLSIKFKVLSINPFNIDISKLVSGAKFKTDIKDFTVEKGERNCLLRCNPKFSID